MLTNVLKYSLCSALLLSGSTTAVLGQVTTNKIGGNIGALSGSATWSTDVPIAKAGNYSIDLGRAGGNSWILVTNVDFINSAVADDEMSFAVWVKKYDIAEGSIFWASSTSAGGNRGWQAHTPWSNNRVYFDTMGCCTTGLDRIDEDIGIFPGYTGDATWWNGWHHFVFSKKASVKEVWIDGQLFLQGEGTAPLAADFYNLYIGAGMGNTGSHGLIDDFAVFGTALSQDSVNKLFTGTLPTALPATDKLTAYWDFNDFPGEGAFTSIVPADKATDAVPNLIQIVHTDGAVPWTTNNIALKVDGVTVTPTLVKEGAKATVTYVPDPMFSVQSMHKWSFTYPGATGTPITFEREFAVGAYTRDVIGSRLGIFTGGSVYTLDGGGRSGSAGDRAADFGNLTGPVHVQDARFLNNLSASDEMAFGFWMKKPGIEAGSAFWANSPGSNNGQRGYQAHVPWSDSNIYFDTAGCCDAGVTRISAGIDTLPTYTGDASWWTNWHYFVFQKKQSVKEVWIDGQLFLTGDGTAPLPTDFTELFIGATAPGQNLMSGKIDDFAIFGTALSQDSITKLFTGTLPTALPATDKLTAYWNFNDFPTTGMFSSIIPGLYSTNARPDLVQVIHWDGATAWEASGISLKVDDVTVNPSFIKNGPVATVTYVTNPLFSPGSTHKATLTYPAGAAQETLEWQFTVLATYPVVSQDLWTAVGTGDSTKPGFKARIWQVDQPGSNSLGNRTHRAEQELAGIIGPNVADLSGATGGVFERDLINWSQDFDTGQIGSFQNGSSPSRPDAAIPGIPGASTAPTDSIAGEVITYVEFPTAGYYVMGVNSDDGFKVSAADTPPANNLALVVAGATSAAGTYHALSAPAGTALQFTVPVSGRLVYMDPADGCTALVNAATLAGNIAFVDRGTCEYSAKLKAAKDAGAIAVVVVNNREEGNAEGTFPVEMPVGAAGYQNIPAVMISMPDGDKIKTGLASGLTVSLTPDATPALGEFDGSRGTADTTFGFAVPAAGVYPFRCVWYEGNGGANLEWFSVTPTGEKILLNDRANTAALKAFRARTATPQPRPTLGLSIVNGKPTLTYTGTLQSAATVNGAYSDVAGATSPYTVDTTSTTQSYYRSRQ